jgi:hypothetical protein
MLRNTLDNLINNLEIKMIESDINIEEVKKDKENLLKANDNELKVVINNKHKKTY